MLTSTTWYLERKKVIEQTPAPRDRWQGQQLNSHRRPLSQIAEGHFLNEVLPDDEPGNKVVTTIRPRNT